MLTDVAEPLTKSQRTKMPINKKLVAEHICQLFYEAIRNEVSNASRGSTKAVGSFKSRSLDEVDKSARKAFRAAAAACVEMDADPRDWVVAQFSAFRAASSFHQKMLWPSPQHLGTLAARVRYLQHQARQKERTARVVVVDEDQDDNQRWYVEERKLKGLARVQRRDPVDVLTEQPEQFSRAFLEHRGVWEVVADLWDERRNS